MKGINITLLILLDGLITGILSAPYFQLSVYSCLLLAGSIALLFLCTHLFFKLKRKQNVSTGILAFILFVVVGLTTVTLKNPLREKEHYSRLLKENAEANLIFTLKEQLKPGFYKSKFIVELEQINNQKASGLLLLNITKDSATGGTKLHVDDRIYTKANLLDLPKLRYPYQFNYTAYLNQKGIYAQLTAETPTLFPLESKTQSLSGYAEKSRAFLISKLQAYNFKPDSQAVLNALLLGQRQDISNQLQDSYVNAGVIHILAVSGLHVGIVMLLLQFILKPLGNYRRTRIIRALLIIVAIWLFAILTGLSPSVLRAATMFSFIQVGLLLYQRHATLNALITSAFVLLLFNPNLIYEVGFQLSYAAVFFIIWLYPKIENFWQPRNRFLKYYWQLIVVSVTAQIGVLPLSLYYFHQFPGVFLLANMIVLPALGLLLIYGIVVLILAALGILPVFIASVYDQLLSLLNRCIAWLSGFDNLLLKDIYFSALLIVVGYLLIFTAGRLLSRFDYSRIYQFLIAMICLPLALVFLESSQTPHFYILQQSQRSLFAEINKSQNLVFYTEPEQSPPQSILKSFKEKEFLNAINTDNLSDFFEFKKQHLLKIDGLGIYKVPGLTPDYIILTQSPRINLDRLISLYPEVKIIADGSNYRSYVARWEVTCRKNKIPFHNTYEKGFYELK